MELKCLLTNRFFIGKSLLNFNTWYRFFVFLFNRSRLVMLSTRCRRKKLQLEMLLLLRVMKRLISSMLLTGQCIQSHPTSLLIPLWVCSRVNFYCTLYPMGKGLDQSSYFFLQVFILLHSSNVENLENSVYILSLCQKLWLYFLHTILSLPKNLVRAP